MYSQTQLREDEMCPRRHFYKYELELEPKRKSLKMWAGSSVHKALAVHYNGGDEEAVLQAFREHFESFPDIENEPDHQVLSDLWLKRLPEYRMYYAHEDWEVLMVPEADLSCEIGLSGDEISAIVDLIIKKRDGTVWVVDHKTAAKTGPSYYTQFFVDKQGSQYVYIAAKVMDLDVVGWMINTIKTTKTDYFEREQFTRTQLQLSAFERQTVHQIGRLNYKHGRRPLGDPWDEWWMDEDYPQHTGQCHGFGTCAFLSLCQVGKAGLPLFEPRTHR